MDREVTVGPNVIAELVRSAVLEVPGVSRVGRGGPAWRRLVSGRAVAIRIHEDRVVVRIWVVARPGRSLATLGLEVGSTVTATVERLLGLELETVTVLIDGVGA